MTIKATTPTTTTSTTVDTEHIDEVREPNGFNTCNGSTSFDHSSTSTSKKGSGSSRSSYEEWIDDEIITPSKIYKEIVKKPKLKKGDKSLQQKISNLETELMMMRHERDYALEEAEEAKGTLNAIMEAMRILSRQMKNTYVVSSSSPSDLDFIDAGSNSSLAPPSITSTQSCSFDLGDQRYNHNNNSQILSPTPDEHNRGRTFTGGISSTSTISSYASEESNRFSELVVKSSNTLDPELSRIGADLLSLSGACRTVSENARFISEESSTMLVDLQSATKQLQQMDIRCHRAEKCAKKLYNENEKLKGELDTHRVERKVLIRKIKDLLDERDNRHEFECTLIDSIILHENLIKNQSMNQSAKVSVKEDIDGELNSDTLIAKDKTLSSGNSKVDITSLEKGGFIPLCKVLLGRVKSPPTIPDHSNKLGKNGENNTIESATRLLVKKDCRSTIGDIPSLTLESSPYKTIKDMTRKSTITAKDLGEELDLKSSFSTDGRGIGNYIHNNPLFGASKSLISPSSNKRNTAKVVVKGFKNKRNQRNK